jgi:hypothetical protein
MAIEWLETMTVALTKREAKTPMSFYNRLLWIIGAMILGPLYANIGAEYKLVFLVVGIVMALALTVWVSYFAWVKPKHLLYGAESHFEEWSIEHKVAGNAKTLSSGASEPLPEGVVLNKKLIPDSVLGEFLDK